MDFRRSMMHAALAAVLALPMALPTPAALAQSTLRVVMHSDLKILDLAELAFGLHPLGIGHELAQSLDIGRKPGEPVGRALLAVEHTAHGIAAVDRHPLSDRDRGILQKRFQCPDRVLGTRDESVGYFGPLRRGWHR